MESEPSPAPEAGVHLGVAPTSAPPRPPICPGCNIQRKTKLTLYAVHMSSTSKLSVGVEQGCKFCPILLQGIEACIGRPNPGEFCLLEYGVHVAASDAVEASLILRGAETAAFFRSPGYKFSPESILNAFPEGYRIPSSTASKESLLWAKAHLEECDESHEKCPDTHSPARLPTRVLDVSADAVKLFQSRGEHGRYVCLSHCWGLGAQMLPLTLTSNIFQREQDIPWDDLSTKFQDAITFTRSLGLHYIWIDSLCIIQDDDKDWRIEGSQMASIYSNAYLVIAAATRYTNPNAGIFSPPDPRLDEHDLHLPDGEAVTFSHSNNTPPETPPSPLFTRRALSHLPINKGHVGWQRGNKNVPDYLDLIRRGWVFQERYLSPRVLFFGPEELSWECSHVRACQCSGRAMRSLSNNDPGRSLYANNDELEWNYNAKRYYSALALDETAKAEGKEQVARRWLRCVEEYTQLFLTFDKDIFPALSGLAHVFGQALGCRYLAGVWEDFVHLGLIWHVEYWGEVRPTLWRAPSWSWASVKTRVRYIMREMYGELSHAAEVVDIKSSPIGPDMNGDISTAHIILKGSLVSTKLRYKEYSGDPKHRHTQFVDIDYLAENSGKIYTDYDIVSEGPTHIPADADVACFFVVQGKESRDCLLLLLRRVLDAGPLPTFERFGLVVVFGDQRDGKDPVEKCITPFSEETTIKIV